MFKAEEISAWHNQFAPSYAVEQVGDAFAVTDEFGHPCDTYSLEELSRVIRWAVVGERQQGRRVDAEQMFVFGDSVSEETRDKVLYLSQV